MGIENKNAPTDKGPAPQVFIGEVGVIKLEGKDALTLVQRLSTGDVRPLARGNLVRDTLFVTAQGRAFAWVSLFVQKDVVFLIVHPSKAAHLAIWLDMYTVMDDVATSDVSAQFARAMVFDASKMANATSTVDTPPGCRPLSFLTWCESSLSPSWEGLKAMGSPQVYLLPAQERAHVGALARARGYAFLDDKTLSQKMILSGVPRDDDELKEEINPFEMRLGAAAISWNKGCYIGQEVLSRLDSYGKVARLIMGFVLSHQAPKLSLEDRESVRLFREDRIIGRVLSWTTFENDVVGLALVKRADATEGPVEFRAPLQVLTGHLCDRPFWSDT